MAKCKKKDILLQNTHITAQAIEIKNSKFTFYLAIVWKN